LWKIGEPLEEMMVKGEDKCGGEDDLVERGVVERFRGGDEEGEREGGVGWLVKKVLSLGCWDCPWILQLHHCQFQQHLRYLQLLQK